MNGTRQCPVAGDGELIHRYVAGTLEPVETEAFEIHLLECQRCQRAVREGAWVAAGLRRHRPRWWGATLRWTVPIAAAAAALWLLLVTDSNPLAQLGRIDPVPQFDGLPVRPALDSATALVDQGMEAYRAGAFDRAAEFLAAAAAREPSPGIQFFLGIARLKTGNVGAGASALITALEPPGNPYAAEARLYLAKAWLALGDADSALTHLAAIGSGPGAVQSHAAALADSIRRVSKP